ncbi:hypothetical protein F5Y10DRAFT_263906 [Nemania abortiva]|nr:hypothetical protein F5Y10DRAFT_263906 [Nemania abortiva]
MHFLLCLAAASLVAVDMADAADVFSINTYIPGDFVLDGEVLHASDNGFFTGLEGPSTKCPITPSSQCPPVAGTLVNGPMESMAVMVSGGQTIYVQADGEVKYSVPHSAHIPPDAIIGGFYHKTVVSSWLPVQDEVIDFHDGRGHMGLVLCYSGEGPEGDKYALFARTAGFDEDACVDLTDVPGLALTKSEGYVGCWQYE